jgi:hypothetical protein
MVEPALGGLRNGVWADPNTGLVNETLYVSAAFPPLLGRGGATIAHASRVNAASCLIFLLAPINDD